MIGPSLLSNNRTRFRTSQNTKYITGEPCNLINSGQKRLPPSCVHLYFPTCVFPEVNIRMNISYLIFQWGELCANHESPHIRLPALQPHSLFNSLQLFCSTNLTCEFGWGVQIQAKEPVTLPLNFHQVFFSAKASFVLSITASSMVFEY